MSARFKWIAALCLFAVAPIAAAQTPAQVDVLIRGGIVFDGAGGSERVADIGVVGDHISFVGDGAGVESRRIIDATGQVVAPGFIDPHTHALSDLRSEDVDQRRALNQLTQGVTTIIVGNDGDGRYDIADLRAELARRGIGVNAGSFVGFGAVRRAVVGEGDRAPSANEVTQMRALVARAMCEGAFGFSTGLYYAPQSFAQTEEVIELAREAGARGGVYETHMRSEGAGNLDALQEALRIGRESGAAVHIAHIKALGRDASGRASEMIAIIERARADGQVVTADQYPWTASGTRVSNALIPRWTQGGGREAMRRRLADTALQARIEGEIASRIRGRGGADTLLILDGPHNGQTLAQAAHAAGIEPQELARRIALEGDARLASFNMSEAEVRTFMALPWVVTSSDGTAGHPRKFASFALKFQRYVREQQVISAADFIRRSSGLTADILGIAQRGYLREGYYADIVVFDPAAFAARADYVNPEELSVGVSHVLVNGVVAIAEGVATGALAGAPLSRRAPEELC